MFTVNLREGDNGKFMKPTWPVIMENKGLISSSEICLVMRTGSPRVFRCLSNAGSPGLMTLIQNVWGKESSHMEASGSEQGQKTLD